MLKSIVLIALVSIVLFSLDGFAYYSYAGGFVLGLFVGVRWHRRFDGMIEGLDSWLDKRDKKKESPEAVEIEED